MNIFFDKIHCCLYFLCILFLLFCQGFHEIFFACVNELFFTIHFIETILIIVMWLSIFVCFVYVFHELFLWGPLSACYVVYAWIVFCFLFLFPSFLRRKRFGVLCFLWRWPWYFVFFECQESYYLHMYHIFICYLINSAIKWWILFIFILFYKRVCIMWLFG